MNTAFTRVFMAFCLLLSAAPRVEAQQPQQKMMLNFHNTDIRSFIEAVGDMTGKTFIIDPAIKGTVTIISANPVPFDIVYDIALHALKLQGISAFKTGEAVTIAQEAKARTGAQETLGGGDSPHGGQVVTKVFPLQFAPTNQISAALKPLMPGSAALTEISSANTLVVTDYADNITRLGSLIEKLDQPKKGALEVMKLKHMSSEDFVKLFEATYSYSTGAGGEPRSYVMLPDSRTNSLIIRCDNPVIMGQIRGFAAKVDVPTGDTGGIRVVKLRYADPVKLAKILSGLNAGKEGSEKTKQAVYSKPGAAKGQDASQPGASGKPAAGSDDSADKGAGYSIAHGIHVDEDSHSLVISAPENMFAIYKNIIESLDIPRKQVYIEGLIAEITTAKMAEFGVQWQSARALDANTAPTVMGVGGVNFANSTGSSPTIGSVTTGSAGTAGVLNTGSGLTLGLINGTLTLADGTVIPNLLSLAHALDSDQATNVIATPTLLTLDNEEAKINVGQNVPLITGSYASTSSSTSGSTSTANPFQTYERKDIGLELKIKSRIVGDDMIQLDVASDVNDLVSGTSAETGGWRYTKRAVKSNIMVKDGKVIVIGGLIQDSYKNTSDKVPLLGDIPIIGALFRYDQKSREKTNLMVFLRPEIISSPDDTKAAVTRKYEDLARKQAEQTEFWSPLLPTLGSPSMPPLEYEKKPEAPAGGTPPGPSGSKAAPTEAVGIIRAPSAQKK